MHAMHAGHAAERMLVMLNPVISQSDRTKLESRQHAAAQFDAYDMRKPLQQDDRRRNLLQDHLQETSAENQAIRLRCNAGRIQQRLATTETVRQMSACTYRQAEAFMPRCHLLLAVSLSLTAFCL